MGLYLKSIGAVSRQAKGESISGEIILDAIEFEDSVQLEIYSTIYNEIYTVNDDISSNRYDLSIVIVDILGEKKSGELIEQIISNSDYLLIKEEYAWESLLDEYRFKPIVIDDDKYRIYFL